VAPMTDNSKRTGAAVEAHYRFLAWLVPTIEKFPKSHKFTIGDRIETIALDVLESWNNNPQHLRSANRNRNTTDNRNNNLGFRVGSTFFARAGAITVAPGEH
jgi:hypothetical protein